MDGAEKVNIKILIGPDDDSKNISMRHFTVLPIIHTPVRLAVITILSQVKEADLNYIKEATGTTDGNLSTHLTKLEKA